MGLSVSNNQISHTYGNVTGFIIEYIKGLFPNYFNYVHTTSQISFRQLGNLNLNKSPGVFKKSKPMLIVAPSIDIDTDDVFLGKTLLTNRLTDNYLDHGQSNLQLLMKDPNNGFEMKYLLNRLKMNFNITIICETQMEQINISHYLKNRVRQNRPFFLDTFLESPIPRDLLDAMSWYIQKPFYDKNGSVDGFLKFLNGISNYPITYKMRTGTGNDEFLMYYKVHLLTAINNLSIDEGSKKGQVWDYFTISFSMPVEFNCPGLFYLMHEDQRVHIYLKDDDYGKSHVSNKRPTYFPLFTACNIYDLPIPEGWTVYGNFVFLTDKDPGEEDTVDFKSLLNNSILEFIKDCTAKGIDKKLFIKIILMKDYLLASLRVQRCA